LGKLTKDKLAISVEMLENVFINFYFQSVLYYSKNIIFYVGRTHIFVKYVK